MEITKAEIASAAAAQSAPSQELMGAEILVKALHETGFNRTAAATRLGLSLRQIRYRIARLNIATPQGVADDEAHDDAA